MRSERQAAIPSHESAPDARPTLAAVPRASELPAAAPSPWLTVNEAAARARCGPKQIYKAVATGQLRAVRLGGRRELRLLAEWVDAWFLALTTR